jgi:protoheme IX farnesyltransferase
MQTKSLRGTIDAFADLARMRIAIMVVISCAVGFIVAYRGEFNYLRFVCVLLGTGLLSGGSCAVNCYIERDFDAMMPRTQGRPIPSGVISPALALLYGASLIGLGALLLIVYVNALTCILGLAATFIYLGMYTPAKRWTWLNTSIGAVPGAIPPLMGWAAAADNISVGAWILFALLFIWQHTHFLPIAWLFRDDYRAAGFKMLPALEDSGEKTFALTIATAILLLPLSAMLYWSGNPFAGPAYSIASIVGGLALVAGSVQWWRDRSRKGARTLLLLSLCYLPAILAAVIVDRVWQWT